MKYLCIPTSFSFTLGNNVRSSWGQGDCEAAAAVVDHSGGGGGRHHPAGGAHPHLLEGQCRGVQRKLVRVGEGGDMEIEL